jgi:hypothetical protein
MGDLQNCNPLLTPGKQKIPVSNTLEPGDEPQRWSAA